MARWWSGGGEVDGGLAVVVEVVEVVDLVSHEGGDNPRYRSLQASCMNCIRVCFRHLARRFWNQTYGKAWGVERGGG